MRILQIYTNDKPFKRVKFNEGFNVVLARVFDPTDFKSNTHNLGKTLLVEVINFMCLKSIDKNHFLKSNRKFQDYVFFIEILLNDGRCVTIKRSVLKNTKISLKVHEERYLDLSSEEDWDYVDLSLNAKVPEKNPKIILEKLFDFDVLENVSYRATLNYFFRTQDDYSDVFKLAKFQGAHLGWKPALYRMLGFDDEIMVAKYEKAHEEKKLQELKVESSKYISVDPKKQDRIRGALEQAYDQYEVVEAKIDSFSFYEENTSVDRDLVKVYDSKITETSAALYRLQHDCELLEKSTAESPDVDIHSLERLYNEANVYFPEQLRKDYSELVEFNKALMTERKLYVDQQIERVKNQIIKVEEHLRVIDGQRSELVGKIKNHDSYKVFKEYQDESLKISQEINLLKMEMENIDVVKQFDRKISEVKDNINDLAGQLEEQVNKSSSVFKNIRKLFSQYARLILDETAEMWLEPNTNGNVDFKCSVTGDSDEDSGSGPGHSYKKMLCACFDISIVQNYIKKSFYRSIYHDGVLESMDNRIKLTHINWMKKLCRETGMQYIITLIEHDAPLDENGKFPFTDEEIVLELDDRPDGTGKLFEFSFT